MNTKRNSGLHIKRSDFKTIIMAVLDMDEAQAEGLTHEIFHRAKPYSINTRTITISNERLEKKATRLLKASRKDADLMARTILAVRRSLKHNAIKQIKPDSRDWGLVKEMAAQAVDFCNGFELTRINGFKKYVQIGASKMKKFGLMKFPHMYESIYLTYQALLEIEQDEDSEMTHEMYEIYSRRIIDNTGIHNRLEELPDKYVWLVRARKEAENMNVAVRIYMAAQFEGLDFTRGIPHPTQFVGAKATERVIKYCYEHGINVKKS